MNIKSERLKKLETELQDLEQWLKLGLVPKKDLVRHKEEIVQLKEKVQEEKERLRMLKESGETEETALKRPSHNRSAHHEAHSLSDVDIGGDDNLTDAGLDMETESFDVDTTGSGEEREEDEDLTQVEEEEEEDPFSDRNRWRRGVLEDPDTNDW